MSFRPKTAQAQRQDRQESSIPIPRTRSIPSLRRQLPSQGTIPPMPLGNSRTQSQIPAPRQLGISRKASIPLRSGLAHIPTQTQVTRKISTTRLRSAPILPPMVGREREKKPLPTRSGLDLSKTFDSNLTNPNAPRGQSIKSAVPVSPSINSVPIVNRLNRKASIPIIARATYITPPGLKFGKTNVKDKGKGKRDEDIFQGGPSIIEPIQPKAKDGIQKMMMRGTRIERPDYLGQGQELQDMSIDLNGTPSPTKPAGERTNRPPIPLNNQFQPRQTSKEKNFTPRSQLARSPLKTYHSFNFNSPIRPSRPTMPEATPLFPRWPKDNGNGYIVDVDEMSMLGEESFRFTGDSVEITSSPFLSNSIAMAPMADSAGFSGKDKEVTVLGNRKDLDLDRLEQEEEMRMLEGRLATITLERDDAILKQEKNKEELREMKYNEVRRGIELELERCGEYRGWLDGLSALVSERGGMK